MANYFVTIEQFRNIITGNMELFSASGFMAKYGVVYFETPTELIAIYETKLVPYIIYQEEGFKHYISGKKVTKNKGFISVKAEGKLNRALWSEVLGIPYTDETNESILDNNDNMLTELGAIINV